MNSSCIISIKSVALLTSLIMFGGCAGMPPKATTPTKTIACNSNQSPGSLGTYSQQIERAGYRYDVQTLVQLKTSLEQNLACNAHPGKYLYYYLGYVNYTLADVLHDDTDKAIPYIDTAEQMLTSATQIDPHFAEAYALLGVSYGIEIGLHPWKGPFLGFKSRSMVKHAIQLDPENPRVVLLKGIDDYSTPVLFGGDEKLAAEEFRKSLVLFNSYKPADADAPSWGKAEAYLGLGYTQADAGDVQQARINYQAALTLEPEYRSAKAALAKLGSKEAAK